MSESPSPIKCMILDLDFFIEEKERGREEPIIRIRGKTRDNEVINIHVRDFYPYFYIDDVPETTNTIQSTLFAEKEFEEWIHDHYQLTKYRYYQNKPIYLYKILGRNPWRIQHYSRFLLKKDIKSYENDISYTSRFLIDTKCKGLNWIEIRNYEETRPTEFGRVYEVNYEDVIPIDEDPFPHNILSLGIVVNSITDEGKKIQNFASILREGDQRIISACISWGHEEGKTERKHFLLENETDKDERDLLQNLVNAIHTISPDIIVTFDGNRIVLPYIFARMGKLGLNPDSFSPLENARIKNPIGYLGYRIPGYIFYDLVKSTRWLRTRSGKKALTDLAFDFIDFERKGDYDTVNNVWFEVVKRNDESKKEELLKLCLEDSHIIHSLFFAMGMQEWIEVMKLVGIRPSEGIYSTPRHLGEFQLLRILHHKDTLIPSEPTQDELAARKSTRSLAVGGFVLVPKGTLHEAVLIVDFSSMFPSIMVAYNIGGESFDGAISLPNQKFRKEPDTGLRIMQRQVLTERKNVKKQIHELQTFIRSYADKKKKASLESDLKKLKIQSNAYKVVANSMYGSHNYVGSRFYDTEISNSITSISKDHIKKVDQWTQEFSENKCQVIYGDTDSVFIKLSEKDKVFEILEKTKQGKVVTVKDIPEAENLLNYFESKLPKEMSLDFVDLALRIVFAPETKKRYSYISAMTGELTIVGFEAIRRDTSPLAREVQTAALQTVLEEGDISKARKQVIEMCLDFKNLATDQIFEKTTILGPIRRNPKEYKSKTPAIGAIEDFARINSLNIEEIWKEYERFPYVIHKGNVPLYKRSKHPSVADPERIDREHYILEALRDVQRIGVKVELKDITPSSQKTLDFTNSFKSEK